MKRPLYVLVALALVVLGAQNAVAAPSPITVGKAAPQFSYGLLNGKSVAPAQLRGHKYILWVMGTWCPSCQAGSQIAAQHIGDLQRHHVALVEMEAHNNLGATGPSLLSVKNGIGKATDASSWYWGVLSEEQTTSIDPKSLMDVFYLVDQHGKVIAQGMSLGAHWAQIESFIRAKE